MPFFSTVVLDFFVALGIVIGGSVVGALGAFLMHHPPMNSMLKLAEQLKIWALVSALGGTFDTLKLIDNGVLDLQLGGIVKQFCYVIAAFLGCNAGFYIVKWLVGDIR
ncbi:YtrH family sporulation protein [Tumebacillus flagellatus]|uniref:Sporulation protein n=1 Tax=Tumebacillus flagellatus TaxID=1157490 RepID=A0A074MCH6_9BACL|nr:YtrH family sporulation protein [Tumebacillus flagellatus]KEO83572.1 sporulation protein [Tumebacillus flagellatus]